MVEMDSAVAARWGASRSGDGAGPLGAVCWLSHVNTNVVATESCAGYVREVCCGGQGEMRDRQKVQYSMAERAREDGLGCEDCGTATRAMEEGAQQMWG